MDEGKSIIEELEETFERAAQSYVRKLLRSERDLAAFDAIRDEAAERERELTRLYHAEYETRVETMRQQLYDQAAQHSLDHPAPDGVADNGDAAITQRAHELVRLHHEADLVALRDDTQQAIEDLLERAHRRNETQGIAAETFLRASDRRSGEDRRKPDEKSITRSQD